MAIHHHNNTRLRVMDLPRLRATGLLHHKVMDHHHHRDILRQTGIRRNPLPLLQLAFAKLTADHKAMQDILLLRADPHPNQAMEGMARHHRSSHQDPTAEDINRYTSLIQAYDELD